jgi:hypothetical protein
MANTQITSPFDNPQQRDRLEGALRQNPALLAQIRGLPNAQQQRLYDIMFSENGVLDNTQIAGRQFTPEHQESLRRHPVFGSLYTSVRDTVANRGNFLERTATRMTSAPENVATVIVENTMEALSPSSLFAQFRQRFSQRGGLSSPSNWLQSIWEGFDLVQYSLRFAVHRLTGFGQPAFLSEGMNSMARDSLQEIAIRSAHQLNGMGMTRERAMETAQQVFTTGARVAGVDIRGSSLPGVFAGVASLGGVRPSPQIPSNTRVEVPIPMGRDAAASREFSTMLALAPSLRDASRRAPSALIAQTDANGNRLASDVIVNRRSTVSRDEAHFLISQGSVERPNPLFTSVRNSLLSAYEQSGASNTMTREAYVEAQLRGLRSGVAPQYNPEFNRLYAEWQRTQSPLLSRESLNQWITGEGANSPLLAGLRRHTPSGVGEMTLAELRQFALTDRQISPEVRADLIARLREQHGLSERAAQQRLNAALDHFANLPANHPMPSIGGRQPAEIGSGIPFPSHELLNRRRQELLAAAQPQPADIVTVRGLASDAIQSVRSNFTVAEIQANPALLRALTPDERRLYEQASADVTQQRMSNLAPITGIARATLRTDPENGQVIDQSSLLVPPSVQQSVTRLTLAEARFLRENAPDSLLNALYSRRNGSGVLVSGRDVLQEAIRVASGSGPDNTRLVSVFFVSPENVARAIEQSRHIESQTLPNTMQPPQRPAAPERSPAITEAPNLLDQARQVAAELTGVQPSQGGVSSPAATPSVSTAEAERSERGTHVIG